MPPALFLLIVLGIGSPFLPRIAKRDGSQSSYFKLPTFAGMTGILCYALPFSCETGVSQTFLAMQFGTEILPISASHIARIIGLSHWHPACLETFLTLGCVSAEQWLYMGSKLSF
jgi:hypothetical protein